MMITNSEQERLIALDMQKRYNLYMYGIGATDEQLKEILEKSTEDEASKFWSKLRGEKR